ncbi:MAG: ribosome maturation factor RimM [Sphingomonadales bacterium]
MPGKPKRPDPANTPAFSDRWICLGAVTGVFGVRGEVRIKPFTEDPEAVGAYGPLTLEPAPATGPAVVEIIAVRVAKGGVIARVRGVTDRNLAEALRGSRLHVRREMLPALDSDDDFYHEDLIDLRADNETGAAVGRVRGVHDFGAGDLLEIQPPDGAAFMVRFTREDVPVVDVPGGRIVVRVPEDGPEPAQET